MLFALGVGDSVVAVTHECDHPAQAATLPHVTRSVIPDGLTAAEIDREVRARTSQGKAIYELDADALERFEPDLIVAQQVCEVCAVSYDDVRAIAQSIPSEPTVLSLDPSTIGEVLADVRTLAVAVEVPEAGERLVSESADRLDRVRDAVEDAERPRVLALEWLDPPYIGGHWVPQMIDLAGGEDVLGFAGERSRTADWDELEAARPEIVVSMPCGYDAERAALETRLYSDRLAALGAERVVAVDASAYFSRPGPRLVDGVELLAHLLHPELVDAPTGRAVELVGRT
jgi:iron complex transport system substrate-binding protein